MCYMGQRNGIQYVWITCPMSGERLYDCLMSDLGYPIESDRRTVSDKRYMTQLLAIKYSINITNAFGGYQYNKECMYVGWITDRIFSQQISGSGRSLTEHSVCVKVGQADPTEYSASV